MDGKGARSDRAIARPYTRPGPVLSLAAAHRASV